MDIDKLKAVSGAKLKLEKFAPDDTYGVSKAQAEKALEGHIGKPAALHDLL